MGHQVGEERPEDALAGVDPSEVPMVTIDQILADRPELKGRRIFIKIDVEGIEPEVIAGAIKHLKAALLWPSYLKKLRPMWSRIGKWR